MLLQSLCNCCAFCPLYPQDALHLQQLTLLGSPPHGKFVKSSIQALINLPITKNLQKFQCHPNLQAETKLLIVTKTSRRGGHVLTGNSPKVSTLPWPRNIVIFGIIVQKLQFMATPSSQLSGRKLHNCPNPYTSWSSIEDVQRNANMVCMSSYAFSIASLTILVPRVSRLS